MNTVERCETVVKNLHEQVVGLAEKIDVLEDSSRRRNLTVCRIKEEDNETESALRESVINIFHAIMELLTPGLNTLID